MSELDRLYDAIVIGSGATGSIAVKELTERGLEVLLLEAGRDVTEADFQQPPPVAPRPIGMGLIPRFKATVRGQHVQSRCAFFGEWPDALLVDDRQNPYTNEPGGHPYLWIRGRVLGGRLHTYGRMLLRMSASDFTGGDGRDAWPIGYAELEPWYDHIERFIGIYGKPEGLPQIPDAQFVGPGYLTAVERDFKAKVEERWPERHVVSWRYAAPNLRRVPLGILAARETGRLTTRTDAVVTRITVDERTGKANGAVFIDRLSKTEHRVSGDVIVLCASAIESVRLLLNSASLKHPNGLGNSSGLLGRYFMDQLPSLTFGESTRFKGWETDTTAPFDPVYAPAGGIYVPRFHNVAGERTRTDLTTGFSYQGGMGRMPVQDVHPAMYGMMGFGEMLPRYENTITLSRKKKDAWRVPTAHITLSLTDGDRALLREQVRTAREMLEHAGFRPYFNGSALGLDSRDVWPGMDPVRRLVFRLGFANSLAVGAGIHECGGARMGCDPATSVLNEMNQSWDVPNLFVTDASCYVTNGMVGPTLTIMALTARACEFIAREHAAGGGL